jgi:hypothetical protein
MNTNQKITNFLLFCAVVVVQVIATQLVTFVASLFLPNMGDFPQAHPVLFILILGITYTIGIYGVGLLALKFHWLRVPPLLHSRLVGTLLGAYLPLVVAVLIYHPREPGNPFFFIAIFTSILGFHLPTWLIRPADK